MPMSKISRKKIDFLPLIDGKRDTSVMGYPCSIHGVDGFIVRCRLDAKFKHRWVVSYKPIGIVVYPGTDTSIQGAIKSAEDYILENYRKTPMVERIDDYLTRICEEHAVRLVLAAFKQGVAA